MSRDENGEQVRHIITRGPHKTDLKVPLALESRKLLLSARVCGTGNEHDKELASCKRTRRKPWM